MVRPRRAQPRRRRVREPAAPRGRRLAPRAAESSEHRRPRPAARVARGARSSRRGEARRRGRRDRILYLELTLDAIRPATPTARRSLRTSRATSRLVATSRWRSRVLPARLPRVRGPSCPQATTSVRDDQREPSRLRGRASHRATVERATSGGGERWSGFLRGVPVGPRVARAGLLHDRPDGGNRTRFDRAPACSRSARAGGGSEQCRRHVGVAQPHQQTAARPDSWPTFEAAAPAACATASRPSSITPLSARSSTSTSPRITPPRSRRDLRRQRARRFGSSPSRRERGVWKGENRPHLHGRGRAPSPQRPRAPAYAAPCAAEDPAAPHMIDGATIWFDGLPFDDARQYSSRNQKHMSIWGEAPQPLPCRATHGRRLCGHAPRGREPNASKREKLERAGLGDGRSRRGAR